MRAPRDSTEGMAGVLQGVIFDFDGLILDTETPQFESWANLYAELGLELSRRRWAEAIGRAWNHFDPKQDLQARLAAAGRPIQAVDAERCWIRRRDAFWDALDREPVRPGVVDWLDALAQHRLPAAIASSSPRQWIHRNLTRHGLGERFVTVCCADDVSEVKPDPEVYRLAVSRLGVDPAATLAFEDSPTGAAAAKAAGLLVVAVPNSITASGRFDAADLVLDSLADLPTAILGEPDLAAALRDLASRAASNVPPRAL